MQVDILSLFSPSFWSPLNVSILKRAQEKGLLKINLINLRDFADGKHRKVDDRPYGGGPGMVLMPGPCIRAIRSVKTKDSHVVYFSPQGNPLKAKSCERLAKKPHLILLCAQYEGVDQRVIDREVDEVISVGDFVLTNGGLPAMFFLDSVARFIPDVLGNKEGAWSDSFSGENGWLEGPQYTRPEEFEGMAVPQILLSGNHKEIAKWRATQSRNITRQVRPELIGAKNESSNGK